MSSLLSPVAIALAVALVYAIFAVRELLKGRATLTADLSGATARLRELERRHIEIAGQFDTLVDLSGIGVMILDSTGSILRANADAAEWLNATVPAMVGRNLLEATLSHELEAVFLQAREIGCIKRELCVVAKSGKIDMVVTVAPVETASEVSSGPTPSRPSSSSAEGGPPKVDRVRYLMILDNVTKLRRLEVVRRDFVANVSHELRTPLTSIRALAETLQQAPLQDRSMMDRYLAMIVTEAERLTRISDDLLVLSAAESKPPVKSKFNLADMLISTVNRFQRQAGKARIALNLDTPGELFVHANHDQIEQVIVNLIDNAIKYTHENGIVRVTAEAKNNSVYIHVSDTGIGIMQQDLSRIFERFYRVDKARSRETGGTGLGLSIVKHIVEAHDGSVTVQSEYNHGTTFTITLPDNSWVTGPEQGIVNTE